LITGNTKSCGCLHELNLAGKKFGKLTVVDFAYSKYGHRYWNCICDCGNKAVVNGTRIKTGETKSCGCYNADSKTTHGLSTHPLYHVYNSMKQRCYNPNCKDYYLYGERNIHMCDEWIGKDGFVNFYNWSIENGYDTGLEIDRIDGNDIYKPTNCRYVNQIEQSNNTNKNIVIEYKGRPDTLQNICRDLKLTPECIYARLRGGRTVNEALSTPTDKKRHIKKDKLYELDGESKTIRDWCKIYDRKDMTVYRRVYNGWDLETALMTPTDGYHTYADSKKKYNPCT